ncbi:MAG: cytochrome bd-I oxidase subunit CydX [Pseudomonadota bacterium]
MWYFAWVLGLSAALMLSVLNAMWFEAQECAKEGGQTN